VVKISNLSGSDLVNFDVTVQEAALGGGSGTATAITLNTATWIGAGTFSNLWFSFTTAAATNVTVTITDLTMGVNFGIYQSDGTTEVVAMTTDGAKDDLTTRTIDLGLAASTEYKVKVQSKAFAGVSVGQMTIASPTP
jgi:hypothetical protein